MTKTDLQPLSEGRYLAFLIMEAALEAFEPGFEIKRDQPVTGPLAGDCTIRRALLRRLAAQPVSGELLTGQREELYE